MKIASAIRDVALPVLVVSALQVAAIVAINGCATDDLAAPGPGAAPACSSCSSDVDCTRGTSCDRATWLCKEPAQYGVLACDAECNSPAVTVAGGKLSWCAYDGRCSAAGGACKATSADACASSWACAHEGRCKLQAAACVKGP